MAHKNAEQAASQLSQEGVQVTVKKLDIASEDVISRYGVILSPALAIGGSIRVAGRIPSPEEIIRIVKATLHQS